mmetsp:Transcript_104306/g.185441  ORF Transcript_104306/g.185441 Transcript_104306/m.185441 type:complete len:202 (+) Transcript_104306:2619-3224(+)
MARFRMLTCSPHWLLQSKPDQSAQAQYLVSSQSVLQSETSSALPISQSLPSALGSCRMLRCLVRWPPHFVQAPQSDHCPHSQSVTLTTWQGWVPHPRVVIKSPTQALPLAVPFFRMVRLIICWPPPQVAEQSSQADQAAKTQSSTGPSEQPSGSGCPGSGLQVSTSLRLVSSQELPLPWASLAICLLRSREPVQVALHSDH